MEQFVNSIRKSVDDENWFSAIYMALTIPDICGGLSQNAKGITGNKKRFINWFDQYLAAEYKYISSEAFWQLRCSILHSGTHIDKKLREALSGSELLVVTYKESPFHDSYVRWDKEQSFVFLRIDVFCKDVCKAIEKWMDDIAGKVEIQTKLNELFFIEKGAKAKEMIMGNVNLTWNKYSIKRMYTDIPAKKGFQPLWKEKPSI